ncbi:Retrotransposon-derived protein PEG10, partial [Zancudomyces culisetae]
MSTQEINLEHLLIELKRLREDNERLQTIIANQAQLVENHLAQSSDPAITPDHVAIPEPAAVTDPNLLSTTIHTQPVKIALPERYDGDRTKFRGFINQCRLVFFTQPGHYPSSANKVGLIMSLLTGNVLRWASPYIEKNSPVLHNFDLFMEEFAKVFDDPQRAQTANDAIRALKQ